MAFIDYLLFLQKKGSLQHTARTCCLGDPAGAVQSGGFFGKPVRIIAAHRIPYFNLLGLHMVLTLLVFLGISYTAVCA